MNFQKTAPLNFTKHLKQGEGPVHVPKVHVTFKKLLIYFPPGYIVLIFQQDTENNH